MRPERPRGCGSTRRAFLAALTAVNLHSATPKGQTIPAAWKRYPDPATEFEVLRLTNPDFSSYLPPAAARAVSRRGTFLLYSSDYGGALQACRLDLQAGSTRQLTDLPELDPSTVAMMPDERSFCCFSGRSLHRISFSGSRDREIYRVPENFDRAPGFAISVDGVHATFVEKRAGVSFIRIVSIARGLVSTAAEVSGEASAPQPRPRRASILYRKDEDELWLAHYDGSQNRQLATAAGKIGQAVWSVDGKQIYYLNFPSDPKKLNNLRELAPDTNVERIIAPTSQFVAFAPNADGSVFVGASGSKASPHVLLLLRATRREFTLCEHKASAPLLTSPVFSPGSQRIYFQSDRHGKPAIYSMVVEKLVERTEQDSDGNFDPSDSRPGKNESR